ncbi:hypothetical protein [Paludibaculum fermentans]|uniref:hypothetical protein n=1 Tax=Paludibaculum fermentans TaxID=1473598 RepID=UPI003EBE1E65
MRWRGFGGQEVVGALEAAGVGFEPAGVAVEGLDEADLAEDPLGGGGFVGAAVFEAGVEEDAFAALVEGGVALAHVDFERERAALRIGDLAVGGLAKGAEVGFVASKHLIARGVGSGSAGIAGGGGFAGACARAAFRLPCRTGYPRGTWAALSPMWSTPSI